jgi:hypothetical protein
VLGGSHFCEPRPVPVLTLCYENLIAFPIHIYGLVRTEKVVEILVFSKLHCFSNMVTLACIIRIYFPISFSQLGFHSFFKLIVMLLLLFIIISISNNSLHLKKYFKVHGNLGKKSFKIHNSTTSSLLKVFSNSLNFFLN